MKDNNSKDIEIMKRITKKLEKITEFCDKYYNELMKKKNKKK